MNLKAKLLLLCDRRGIAVADALAIVRLTLDAFDDQVLYQDATARTVGKLWRDVKDAARRRRRETDWLG